MNYILTVSLFILLASAQTCTRYISDCTAFNGTETQKVLYQEALYKNGTSSYILEYISLITGDCSRGMDLSIVYKKSINGLVDNTDAEHTYTYSITDAYVKTNDINYLINHGYSMKPIVNRDTLVSIQSTTFEYITYSNGVSLLDEMKAMIGKADSITFKTSGNTLQIKNGSSYITYTTDGNDCDSTQFGWTSENTVVTWIWVGVAIFVAIMIVYVIISTIYESKHKKN
ncbi:hypothetical protein WA158_003078 [Blastocystis sp. Blastoise]